MYKVYVIFYNAGLLSPRYLYQDFYSKHNYYFIAPQIISSHDKEAKFPTKIIARIVLNRTPFIKRSIEEWKNIYRNNFEVVIEQDTVTGRRLAPHK